MKRKDYASYETAMKFIRETGISSQSEYRRKYADDPLIVLPCDPSRVYREWTAWRDFCGTTNSHRITSREKRNLLPYEEAKLLLYDFCSKNNTKISTELEYKMFVKSDDFMDNLSMNIPVGADLYYTKTGEWKGWPNFLPGRIMKTLTFSEMKELFSKNNINSLDDMFVFISENPEYKKKISSDIEDSCKIRGDWGGWNELFGVKKNNRDEIEELKNTIKVMAEEIKILHEKIKSL